MESRGALVAILHRKGAYFEDQGISYVQHVYSCIEGLGTSRRFCIRLGPKVNLRVIGKSLGV